MKLSEDGSVTNFEVRDRSRIIPQIRVKCNNGLHLDICIVEQEDWYDALVVDVSGVLLEGEREGYVDKSLPNKSFWLDQPWKIEKFIRALAEIDVS